VKKKNVAVNVKSLHEIVETKNIFKEESALIELEMFST